MNESKQSASGRSVQFSLSQFLIGVVLVAILLAPFLKYGPLSTFVSQLDILFVMLSSLMESLIFNALVRA